MSFWTSLRNAVEGVASVAGNYFLPGSSLITAPLASKGAQQMLSSPIGQLAMMGSGVAGGAAGNLSNYGSMLSDLGVNITSLGSTLPSGVANTFGLPTASNAVPFTGPATGASQMMTDTGLPASGWSGGATGGAAGGVTGNNKMFSWGSPLNLMQLGSGATGVMQSQNMQKMAQQLLQQQASYGDPARAALAGQFAPGNLLQMPTAANLTSLPGYQSGLEAVQRSMAAQGYTGSGNMMTALQQYGGQFYNNALQQYQQQQQALMGAAVPSTAPAAVMATGSNMLGQGLGNLNQAALLAALGNKS